MHPLGLEQFLLHALGERQRFLARRSVLQRFGFFDPAPLWTETGRHPQFESCRVPTWF